MDTTSIELKPALGLQKKFLFCHSIANFLFNRFRFFGSRKLSRAISKIILPKLRNRISCPTIYGFDLVLRPENGLEIYTLGFYEVGTLNVFKNCLREGDTFVDVGASIGLMSFYAAQLVGNSGKVLSFEPTKDSFTDLSKGIEINRFSNIKPFNLGLGREKKELKIYMDRACPSMVPGNNTFERYEIVNIEKLDAVLEKENIREVRMIKIDVEGYETEVLKGAEELISGTNAPIICIEYIKILQEAADQDPLDFIRKSNNYKFYQLIEKSNTISKLKEITDGKFHYHDNVYCFLPDHITEIPSSLFID